MSYILDALRKADAERERDPARGIHAHPVVTPMPARSDGRWPMAMTVGAIALAAAAAAVWWWPKTPPAAAEPVAAVRPLPVTAVVAPQVPLAPPVPATEVQPPPPPPLEPYITEENPLARGVTPPAQPQPQAAALPAAAAAPVPAATPAAAAPAAAMPLASPAAAATSTTDRILNVAELPPDVLRDLPKLVIGGGVYSDNRAQRMLIVGGQVVGEGAELAPGLKLEEIRHKSAVLRFRGLRYSVGY